MLRASLALLLVGNLALSVWGVRRWRRGVLPRRPSLARWSGLLAVAALWALAYPRGRFVQVWGLWDWPATAVVQLRGLLLGVALLGGQGLLWLGGGQRVRRALGRWRSARARRAWRFTAPLAGGLMLVLLVAAALIARTGVGLHTTRLNWYEPITPVLPGQFYLAGALAVLGVAWWPRRRLRSGWVVLMLWALTFLWWGWTPTQPTYFEPAPAPPTYQPLPWSDAQVWDIYAWQLLLGLRPDPLRDHIGYAGLLAWLHRWLGMDYRAVALAQVALLAWLPGLIYLLGTALGSQSAGLAAALLIMAQGANLLVVGSKVNNQVHPRMLMTEWPTSLLLALATWALVRWGRTRGRAGLAAGLAGGALALATMFRVNALALLPAFAVGALWLAGRRWRRGMLAVAQLTMVAFLVWGPWMVRSQERAGTPWFFLIKVRYALNPWFRTPAPQGALPDPVLQAAPPGGVAGSGVLAAPHAVPSAPQSTAHVLAVVGTYWVHNLATHFFALPFGLRAYDLAGLRRAAPVYRLPFWQQGLPWKGPWPVLLVVYLFVLAWGLAAAWRRARWAGWVPLGVALVYHLSTAAARTGGARYLVPVVWVLWLYVALGLADLARGVWAALGVPTERGAVRPLSRGGWFEGVALLAMVALPVWMAVRDAQPPRYPRLIRRQTAVVLQHLPGFQQAPFEAEAFAAFWRQKGAVVLWGQALYPRYYAAGEGIDEPPGAVEAPQPYDRMVGYLLFAPPKGQNPWAGVRGWILPQAVPPQAGVMGEVVIVGCERPPKGWLPPVPWIDVLFMWWQSPDGPVWLAREPLPPPEAWRCPLPPP